MNCERIRESLPVLVDGRVAPTALPEVRAHLSRCADCRREFDALAQTAAALDTMPSPQPSPLLRTQFYAMLEEEKNSTISRPSFPPLRPAERRPVSLWRWVLAPLVAGALLLIGFALGQRAVQTPDHQARRSEERNPAELVALRDQLAKQTAQLEKMTTLVGYSILQQQQNPANERLQDVLIAAREAQPKPKVIDDLIKVLTLDPNANVRLRAIEALYPHAEREVVRAGVLAALPREQNPLVQLQLIDFVATARDHDATTVLETIAADESTNGSVRDAAKRALAQL